MLAVTPTSSAVPILDLFLVKTRQYAKQKCSVSEPNALSISRGFPKQSAENAIQGTILLC